MWSNPIHFNAFSPSFYSDNMEQSDENLDMKISDLIEIVGDGEGHFKESDLYEIANENGISREEIRKFLADKSRSKISPF